MIGRRGISQRATGGRCLGWIPSWIGVWGSYFLGCCPQTGNKIFPWLGSVLSLHVTLFFCFVSATKTALGEFLVWEMGKGGAGERGEGGRCEMEHFQWQTATHTNVALDDWVDIGDSAMMRSWAVYTNVHT